MVGFIAILLALLASPPGTAPAQPRSAEHLYQDCKHVLETGASLVLFGEPASCGTAAIMALTDHSIIEGQPDYARREVPPFCLPANSAISVENLRPLITPFLRYFEANSDAVRDIDGRTAFLDAMRWRWPCHEQR